MRVLIFSLIVAATVIGGLVGWRAAQQELGKNIDIARATPYVISGAAIGFTACMALGAAWQLAGMS